MLDAGHYPAENIEFFESRAIDGLISVGREKHVLDDKAQVGPAVRNTDDLIAIGEERLLERGLVTRGQEVVVLAGHTPMKGATNTMKVYAVGTT